MSLRMVGDPSANFLLTNCKKRFRNLHENEFLIGQR